MPAIVTIRSDAIQNTIPALFAVSKAVRDQVIPRALNRTGDTVGTHVKRAISKRTSIPKNRIDSVITKRLATAEKPRYIIKARDTATSLKEFNPTVTRKGIKARVWGRLQTYRGTFIGPNGHVYKRAGKSRLPIERLSGPVLPNEMLREEVTAIADEIMQRVHEKNIRHELKFATGKIKPRTKKV